MLSFINEQLNDPSETNSEIYHSEIQKVLEYYEKQYTNFLFLGPYPINYKDIYEQLLELDWNYLKQQNQQLAILWNTDIIGNEGEHVVVLYIDFSHRTACYFDSLAQWPPQNIVNLLNNLVDTVTNLTIYRNLRRFQQSNLSSNCGVFAIHFIVCRLKGINCIDFFNNSELNDETCDQKRKYYFDTIFNQNL